MEEIWKPIPGYDGIYDASNTGHIRSSPGKTTHTERHGTRHWEERVLKEKYQCRYGRRGDYRVELWKDGEHKTFLVSRLVAMAWHGVPQKGMTVNHINGISTDNRAENLEWLSLADNIKEGHKNNAFAAHKRWMVFEDECGNEYTFDSMLSASHFLNRRYGYLSYRLRHNFDTVVSADGTTFFVKSKKR